ncbi:MAG: HisA/HisF-related TIM barrel protein, partial [Actinobacteria bacterium]|nr:HisA/HisF-related TIM barrel protein [Actinomycetota bacterium]
LANLDLVSSLIERLGEKLVVGIETDGGSIRPRGRWGDEPGAPIDLMAAVDAVVGLGARRLLVTHVARVGGLGGTDEAVIRRIIERVGSVPVVASGGAASLAEIEGLKEAGVEAVVIGRALYEGDLDLASAIRSSDEASA